MLRGDAAEVKAEHSVCTVPMPAYLVPEFKQWKLACPVAAEGFVFPSDSDMKGRRRAIGTHDLLRGGNVLPDYRNRGSATCATWLRRS